MEVRWTTHVPQTMQRHTGSYGEAAFSPVKSAEKSDERNAPAKTTTWSLADCGLPQPRD